MLVLTVNLTVTPSITSMAVISSSKWLYTPLRLSLEVLSCPLLLYLSTYTWHRNSRWRCFPCSFLRHRCFSTLWFSPKATITTTRKNSTLFSVIKIHVFVSTSFIPFDHYVLSLPNNMSVLRHSKFLSCKAFSRLTISYHLIGKTVRM